MHMRVKVCIYACIYVCVPPVCLGPEDNRGGLGSSETRDNDGCEPQPSLQSLLSSCVCLDVGVSVCTWGRLEVSLGGVLRRCPPCSS